jgi:hypothetical protein
MRGQLGVQAAAAHRKLAARMAAEAYPLDYSTAMRVIRDALAAVLPAPVVVAEGANTMDNARCARAARSPGTQGRPCVSVCSSVCRSAVCRVPGMFCCRHWKCVQA